MAAFYGEAQRTLQDQFDTRRIADKIEAIAVKNEIDPMTQGFLESRNMFFLSTVDAHGCPTVSYKGGDAGFVRVLDAKTIAFPSYDGNGMYLSMGNMNANPNVGMLFIDFETPHRVRVQGRARVSSTDPLLATFKEAQMVVRVEITQVFQNCPRYIHKMQQVRPSRYVPRTDCETPVATWKRIDMLQGDIPKADLAKVAKAGPLITIEDWMGKIMTGAEDA